MVPFIGDHEEGMVFETAAGLAAGALLRGESKLLLMEDIDRSDYRRWAEGMMGLVRPSKRGPIDTWAAVALLRGRGLIKGYILYRYDTHERPWHGQGEIDESANVATALAPIFQAVAVSERLKPKAEEIGLRMLFDARGRREEWCLRRYEKQFSRELLMTADPKSRVARSLAVATRAFVVSQPGPVYEAALARCIPDSPVLGWGCGAEDAQTLPSSEWGLFQTATNWCHNLPVFSTEQIGETVPLEKVRSPKAGLSLGDLQWRRGVHYVTFIMSDGDNVQWMMGNFAGGSEGHHYYESPLRGRFPIGWTFPYVDLAQLCPYVLMDLFTRASPCDDFVLLGGGYYYPDRFGTKRVGNWLAVHARRIGEYMRAGGLRSLALNLQDWDSPAAVASYRTLAENIPSLDGFFTVQYYPYTAGEGQVIWVAAGGRQVPVVSCKMCIWAKTGRVRETTPASVAAMLNQQPTGGPRWSEENFSFVMAHAWSRFRNTHGNPSLTAEEEDVDQTRDAPGVERGLAPVGWTIQRLRPQVVAVTPSEFLLLMHLHLRTRPTLTAWLRELRARTMASRSKPAAKLLGRAEEVLASVRNGDESGRECFELLRRAERLLNRAR